MFGHLLLFEQNFEKRRYRQLNRWLKPSDLEDVPKVNCLCNLKQREDCGFQNLTQSVILRLFDFNGMQPIRSLFFCEYKSPISGRVEAEDKIE